jgi:hypothetical protein
MNDTLNNLSLDQLIIELWHIAKVYSFARYDRMLYIKSALLTHYPNKVKEYSGKKLWLLIEEVIS